MKITDFVIPESLDDARHCLCDSEGIPAAGCTAFHFYADSTEKKAVLLTRLGLNEIHMNNQQFEIGALTNPAALIDYTASGWVLNRVAVNLASHQIRNMSTLGGNIARVFPWADFPVALLALGGSVRIQGETSRTIDADEYFAAQPANLFQTGDLLTAVLVSPVTAPEGFGHVKKRMKSEAFSLATSSVRLTVENNRISLARVALGAAIAFPARVAAVEAALIGTAADDDTSLLRIATEGLDSFNFLKKEGMSKDYIKQLAAAAVFDAVQAAVKDAQGGAA